VAAPSSLLTLQSTAPDGRSHVGNLRVVSQVVWTGIFTLAGVAVGAFGPWLEAGRSARERRREAASGRRAQAYADLIMSATDCRQLLAHLWYNLDNNLVTAHARSEIEEYNDKSAEVKRLAALIYLLSPDPVVRDAATAVEDAVRAAFEELRNIPKGAKVEESHDAPEPLQGALTAIGDRVQRFANTARQALGD
jgi:hypothetical protein